MVRIVGKAAAAGGFLAAIFASVPAFADVKAGVDAWTRGDYAAAVREWADPAAKGDPDAQFNMAQAYRLGRGIDIDLDQAEALYARAAAQGHVKAADNYGLLLFQRGDRERAMPYVEAAAGRGDPRAQYLLGIAHFNGDLVEKDWRRAYALLTLANGAGLPQARGALAQMDEYVTLEDRQAAQTLAAALKTEADATRARDLAAVDLALGNASPAGPVVTAPPQPPVNPRTAAAGGQAAGADYARPVASPVPAATVVARQEPARETVAAPPAVTAPVAVAQPVAQANGPWKVQLGAFGVAGNADRLWTKLANRRELAGRRKITEPAGRLTKLLAGGYATQAEAQAACNSLKASGNDCLITR